MCKSKIPSRRLGSLSWKVYWVREIRDIPLRTFKLIALIAIRNSSRDRLGSIIHKVHSVRAVTRTSTWIVEGDFRNAICSYQVLPGARHIAQLSDNADIDIEQPRCIRRYSIVGAQIVGARRQRFMHLGCGEVVVGAV